MTQRDWHELILKDVSRDANGHKWKRISIDWNKCHIETWTIQTFVTHTCNLCPYRWPVTILLTLKPVPIKDQVRPLNTFLWCAMHTVHVLMYFKSLFARSPWYYIGCFCYAAGVCTNSLHILFECSTTNCRSQAVLHLQAVFSAHRGTIGH